MRKLYDSVKTAVFIDRPNRFIVHVLMDGKRVTAHMPNPRRMRELLFPGAVLYVTPHGGDESKTHFRVIGADRRGTAVFLDTMRCNDVAAALIQGKCIPGWEKYHIEDREVTMGDSRFDLLLSGEGHRFPVEVKSCTLFSRNGAMFPDAVTARGQKHLRHLSDMGRKKEHAGLLFLVQWDKARWFLPDYHTDPEFARAFLEGAPFIDWKAAAVHWTPDFLMPDQVSLLPCPMNILRKEAGNRGDYFLILRLDESKEVEIGRLGNIYFQKGYYVYVGSARKNLRQRLERHKRIRKNFHWHIDYLRNVSEFAAAVPVCTSDDLEHTMAQALASIAEWEIPGFGCTDCRCRSHLFGMKSNPLENRAFIEMVEDFRMNRINSQIGKRG